MAKCCVGISNLLSLRKTPDDLAKYLNWLQDGKSLGSSIQRITRHEYSGILTSGGFDPPSTTWPQWTETELNKDQQVTLQIDRENEEAFVKYLKQPIKASVVQIEISEANHKILIDGKLAPKMESIRSIVELSCHGGLVLRNLYIENLTINIVHGKLIIENCWINNFSMSNMRANFTKITGGGIMSFICGNEGNSFGGDFIMKGVYIPRSDDHSQIEVQDIRNIRKRLVDNNNNPLTAGVFHSVELSLERKNETRWNKFVSYIYEVGADYGNSISRSIGWFIIFIMLITIVVCYTDAVRPENCSVSEWQGWHRDICGESNLARFFRSFVYSWQIIFNPLNVFSSKSLLIINSIGINVIITILGLLGTLSLAFFVICLRRRFKMD